MKDLDTNNYFAPELKELQDVILHKINKYKIKRYLNRNKKLVQKSSNCRSPP
jgi:hypothetical protein